MGLRWDQAELPQVRPSSPGEAAVKWLRVPLLGALCACLLYIAGCAPPAPRATAPATAATFTPVAAGLPAPPTATETGPGTLPPAVTRVPAPPTATFAPPATPAQPTAQATLPPAVTIVPTAPTSTFTPLATPAQPTAQATLPAAPSPSPAVEIANPAAAYCQRQGYTDRILTAADGSQYGACVAPGGKECDEWAFFHHQCALPALAPAAQASPPRLGDACGPACDDRGLPPANRGSCHAPGGGRACHAGSASISSHASSAGVRRHAC